MSPVETLDLQTLFRACRKLEKYYGGVAELVGEVAWRIPSDSHGIDGRERTIPGLSAQVASDCRTIADDDPIMPPPPRPCPTWPRCETLAPHLIDYLIHLDIKVRSVALALEPLKPYFTPNPPPFPGGHH